MKPAAGSPQAGWLYWCGWFLCRMAGRIVWRMRIYGAEKVPRTGPIIVACNHQSYLDPPMMGSACPRAISYMAKRELFAIPVLGPLIGHLNAFPVDRSRGDVAAIKRAVQALREGRALGIFPEGGRNRTGGPVEPQAGIGLMIKLAGGATVVPAYVGGTDRAKALHSITVTFGDPIRFERKERASREDVAKWTAEIMTRIYALRGAHG